MLPRIYVSRPLLILGCLLLSTPAWAQLPVTDGLALGQRVVQIGQAVLQTAEAVAQTANMVLELTPVDELIAADGIIEDMGTLAEIVTDARALSYDLSSLNAQIHVLFDLETAPRTRRELDERLIDIKRTVFEARTFALRTQTLMMTVLRTVDHLTRLLGALGDLVGNMQANQRLAELQGTVSKTLAVIEVQSAAFQRADIVERMSADLVKESMARIQDRRLEDWPRD